MKLIEKRDGGAVSERKRDRDREIDRLREREKKRVSFTAEDEAEYKTKLGADREFREVERGETGQRR